MRKAINELWKVFITSIRDLQEPFHRIMVGIVLILLTLFVVGVLLGMCFGFIKDMTELIINAIGEPIEGI